MVMYLQVKEERVSILTVTLFQYVHFKLFLIIQIFKYSGKLCKTNFIIGTNFTFKGFNEIWFRLC